MASPPYTRGELTCTHTNRYAQTTTCVGCMHRGESICMHRGESICMHRGESICMHRGESICMHRGESICIV